LAINSVRSEERRAVAAAVERQLPRYVVVVRNCAYKAGKVQVKGKRYDRYTKDSRDRKFE
jgi:hypothetical protein